ncbi:MAG TPA: hypothetical protein VK943_14620, partial [Arenibaculum sp.]|nr:hypothetical protein [Arenibaculum sp.]
MLTGVFVSNNVPVDPTNEDRAAALSILPSENRPSMNKAERGFDKEVALIRKVQDAVLSVAPDDKGIELGRPREVGDLLGLGYGLCYDRSRAIEKILKMYGMATRHAAIYSTAETGSALVSLMTPQVPSHAVSEVLTSRGWMVVDSNSRWIGLTSDGTPVALDELSKRKGMGSWAFVERSPSIFMGEFTW